MNRSFIEEFVFEVMKTNKGIKNMPGVETGRRLLLSCAGGIEKKSEDLQSKPQDFFTITSSARRRLTVSTGGHIFLLMLCFFISVPTLE